MYRLRKVSRKDKERRFLGVCAGISKYINPDMDPVGIRILWVILSCFAPVMIVLYFLLAIVLKPEDYEIKEEVEKEPETKE
jgi:phage shock protein C